MQRFKPKSEFVRHVATLASGSLMAQFVTLASTPILTRLYSPESYAVFALYIAIVSTIAPAVSGRYDEAVVIAKDEKDSDGLLVLSLWVAGFVALLIFLVFTLGQQPLIKLLNAKSLTLWWYLAPASILFIAIATAIRYYANRHKRYELISRLLVAQALFTTILSIGLGAMGNQSHGLLVASLLGAVFGVVFLTFSYRNEFRSINWWPDKTTWKLASRYKQFPIYNATTSFLDSLTLALPVFFLTKHFPEAIVGYYALLIRITATPLRFISSSISQVYLRQLTEQIHNNMEPTRYFLYLSIILVGIALLPTLVLMLYAPSLIPWIFGAEWRMAGELLVILMPALALRFVVSTLSSVPVSTGNNHLAAFWKVIALIGTFLMFWMLADRLSIQHLFIAMMITDLVLYSIYYYLIWYSIKHPKGYV